MAKCANCANDAKYEYNVNGVLKVLYCNTHLPKFLTAQKLAGHLALTPEPVVEPVVEEVVEEAPKPKKKAATSDASDS